MEILRLQFGVDYKEWKEMDRFFLVSKEVLGNLKPMYEKFLPTIRSEIKAQFAAEGKPKWKSLKPSYLASFKKATSKYPTTILKLTGNMWKAATNKGAKGNICVVNNDGFSWGIDLNIIPYARLHDKGGKLSGKSKGWMQQREFLKLSKSGVARLVQTAHRFIRSKMKTQNVKMD